MPIRTLNLWVKKYRDNGLVGLARQLRGDKDRPRTYDSMLQKTIEGLYLNNPKLSSANIHRLIVEHCKQINIKVPSYRIICRIIHSIPGDLKMLGTQGSKAYKQKYDLIHIRSAQRPNEIWQADHVLIDIEVINDQNKLQKPWLTIIIDDCSRSICGYELSFLSPSSQKTSLCLRHAIWRKSDPKWNILGIPAVLYTDHGTDFTSKHIELVCVNLKIRMIYSQLGQPRGRGKLERFFRTLNQMLISKLHAITQNGKTPRCIDLKTLDELIYKFIIEYNHTHHSDLGMSPNKRWELNGFLPQMLDDIEPLDLLLLTEAKSRKILRDGIHFQGLRYIDITLAEYIGENVVIRYNPSDITSIRVFYKSQFLCQPLCSELSQTKVGIKEIQKIRNERRRNLRKKIMERKSLVDAVIEANSKNLTFSFEEEPLTVKEEKLSGLKLYEHE